MHYQLCPKCAGQKTVSKPPWVAGDVYQWSASESAFPCDICNGAGILLVPDSREEKRQYLPYEPQTLTYDERQWDRYQARGTLDEEEQT